MKLVTSAQMRELERRASGLGLSAELLMEKAGLAVAQEVRKLLDRVAGRRILVLVGPGNNGGDGLVAARHLDDWGASVTLCLTARRHQEGDLNLRRCRERDIPYFEAEGDPGLASFRRALAGSELVIDALLGTGNLRPIAGGVKEILALVAEAKAQRPALVVVALDLPSGLDADSGAVDPATLVADVTVTLGYPKRGLFAFPGADRVGRIVAVDIGLPAHLAGDIRVSLVSPEWVRTHLPLRPQDAHKGSFGRVLVVAGSRQYVGAARLACAGALRVGAGLVTLAVPPDIQPLMGGMMPEVTYLPLPPEEPGLAHPAAAEAILGRLAEYNALVVGPGLGREAKAAGLVRHLLFSLAAAGSPALVLDADALNILAETPGWPAQLKARAVLTPHPGEMARLRGLTVPQVQAQRLELAGEAAREWGQVVALKGACTVVAAPDGESQLCPFVNPGLASGGTGDVLSGAIAGLLAQGLSPQAAAVCGVYLHGLAGELAWEELGDAGMVASDVAEQLPRAIRRLKEGGKVAGVTWRATDGAAAMP
ncbi:MAG: NAD(P)H-hydrate dehydratase [Chloroflexi bacterium]|nr:NAD(P)H-hydrate dehydratase [Chloroflexota bacterium]